MRVNLSCIQESRVHGISVSGKRLSRKSDNVVVFPFAFHIVDYTGCLLGKVVSDERDSIFLYPEGGSSRFPHNAGKYLRDGEATRPTQHALPLKERHNKEATNTFKPRNSPNKLGACY
jgi:hypothetical protein